MSKIYIHKNTINNSNNSGTVLFVENGIGKMRNNQGIDIIENLQSKMVSNGSSEAMHPPSEIQIEYAESYKKLNKIIKQHPEDDIEDYTLYHYSCNNMSITPGHLSYDREWGEYSYNERTGSFHLHHEEGVLYCHIEDIYFSIEEVLEEIAADLELIEITRKRSADGS